MSNDKIRQDFEVWAKEQGHYILEPAAHRADRYYWAETQNAWEAWQAALSNSSNVVAWYVFANTEHWVTMDEDEAEENREEGCQVSPLVFAQHDYSDGSLK